MKKIYTRRRIAFHSLFKSKMAVLALLLSFSALGVSAQNVTGTLTDSDGEPIIGATIMVDGTTVGTVTDINGNFTIKANPGDDLNVSFMGFRNQTITVDESGTISVAMEADTELLDEVVVVGYGTRKKSHNTGAISQTTGSEIAKIQANRVDDALAGKLAGVLIQNQDGAPGADPKIQVRAASSLSGDSNPLIVVDGYPISGSLATVNPNDIESLEILKDAASAAIYGSRGANGVVLVTTKKGNTGKPRISYDAYVSTSHRYVRDNILDQASDMVRTMEEQRDAGNVDFSVFDVTEEDDEGNVTLITPGEDVFNFRLDGFRNTPEVQPVEDWLFQNGVSTSHNLSYSGGTDDINYYASIGYLNTEGVVRTQAFERFNARLNLDAKLGKRFKTGLSLNGFSGDRDIVGHDMRDLLRAYSVHPIYHTAQSIEFVQGLSAQAESLGLSSFDSGYRGGNAPFNNSISTLEPGMTAQDWHYGRSGNGIGGSGDAGPATKLNNTDRYQKTLFGNISTYLQYDILEGLNVKTLLGADMRDTRDFHWRGLEFDSRARGSQTFLNQNNVQRSSVLSETTLNYGRTIELHDIGAVVGVEFQNFFIDGTRLSGTNLAFNQPQNYSFLNPEDITTTERDETVARRSVFGRINYAFDNRYLASASIRRDGDSRFGANNRHEVFPAFSLGWNVHNEAFWGSNFVSGLKLRFSTGSLGTTSFLGSYSSLSLLDPQATIFGTGFLIPSDLENLDLTWQTNTETNYGANIGLLQNRIRLGVDYYTSDTEDMLISKSVSEVLGTTSVILNAGDVTSSGFEFEIGATVLNRSDFRWDINANLSTVSTEITSLGENAAGDPLLELPRSDYGQSGRHPIWRNYVGGEIGEMWGVETTGVVPLGALVNPVEFPGQESGYSFVVDQQAPGEEGHGVIDRSRTVEEGGDLVKIGQNTPDFYYGFNTNFGYKDFDVSLQFQGAEGGQVWNVDPLYYGSQWGRALKPSFLEEAEANGQFIARNRDETAAMIQDASYLALRNLTIGYRINNDKLDKFGIGSLRVYVASSNLLYLMGEDYTSFNPEGVEITNGGYLGPTTFGLQVGASPVVRSFSIGINANF